MTPLPVSALALESNLKFLSITNEPPLKPRTQKVNMVISRSARRIIDESDDDGMTMGASKLISEIRGRISVECARSCMITSRRYYISKSIQERIEELVRNLIGHFIRALPFPMLPSISRFSSASIASERYLYIHSLKVYLHNLRYLRLFVREFFSKSIQQRWI